MPWIVSRVATKNPDINGRTLYLTKLGMWSLDRKYAREFFDHYEAEKWARPDAVIETADGLALSSEVKA